MEHKSKDEMEELISAMRDPKSGLDIQDRKWMLKTYPKCFIGRDAVTWMNTTGYANSREDAVNLGNILLDLKIFHHVTKDHKFKDEELYYRFADDEVRKSGTLPEDVSSWAQFLPTYDYERGSLQPKIRESDSNMLSEIDELEVKPLDEFNVQLLDNVHPPKWINPAPEGTYNLVVIGAGAGGLVSAAGSAGLGAKVAIIEKHLLGGDCLNVGCVPSKALIRAAHAANEVKNSSQFGIKIKGEVEIDFPAIMERMRKLRAQISPNDSAKRFANDLGVDVFIGEGKFVGKDSIQVGDKILKFAKCVIATGGRPAIPPIPGIEKVKVLTNTNLFNLTTLPKKLLVIGSGPIGCEMAQTFQRFGSQVTILTRDSHLMPREDADAAEVVQKQFEKDGVKMIFNCKFEKVEQIGEDRIVHVTVDGKSISFKGDELLVSTGRKPNVEGLNLEVANVKYDTKHGIKINDNLQTTNSNIFAVGDVCTEYKFTHISDWMARLVIRNALFFGSSKFSSLIIPWATYTSPEIAHVGLYEQDMKDQGIKYNTYKRPLKHVDRAILDSEEEGFVKIHVKAGSDQILGATIVASHAGDMISEITTAMNGGMGLGKIAAVIHPYPTQAEAIRQLGDEFNRTRLTPFVKILFRKILAARK